MDQFIVLLNGEESHQIPFPLGHGKGIAVDQDYVWAYLENSACCASHASVVKSLRGGHIDWIQCPNLPASKLQELYPCDDGTVTVDLPNNGGTFSADYRVDLAGRKMTSFAGSGTLQWTKVRDNSANSFEKLPLFCWPSYESLTETLEALQKVFDRP